MGLLVIGAGHGRTGTALLLLHAHTPHPRRVPEENSMQRMGSRVAHAQTLLQPACAPAHSRPSRWQWCIALTACTAHRIATATTATTTATTAATAAAANALTPAAGSGGGESAHSTLPPKAAPSVPTGCRLGAQCTRVVSWDAQSEAHDGVK